MVSEPYHYPPDVFNLLVDTIPLLCKSKRDVLIFLRGAGVSDGDLAEVDLIVETDKASITKRQIVLRVLTKLNARGDDGLRARRELLKRVIEFRAFDTCWDDDRLKAQALVAQLRETVQAKDWITQIKLERERDLQLERDRHLAEQRALEERRIKIQHVHERLTGLFREGIDPQQRGRLLEHILNELFETFEILVHKDFRRHDDSSGALLEQIDSIIKLEGHLYFVEMKWLKTPVDVAQLQQHVSRLYLHPETRGIVISVNGYTSSAVQIAREALAHKIVVLCTLREIILLLERRSDLLSFLSTKIDAAIIQKNPCIEHYG